MLHLQATMHFPGEGASTRSGGWAQIHLCWMVWLEGWVEEGPGQSGNPQVFGQPVTCFCILLVPPAPPCFWETQTILQLAVDLPEPMCLSVVTE